jgi:hypothetical protein
MDDAGIVRSRQSVRDLRREIEKALRKDGAAANLLSQRSPFDQFRHDVRRVIVERSIEHCHDVRVAQRAGRSRLCHELLRTLRDGVAALVQDLECNLAFEPRIPRAIDRAASSFAEKAKNPVRAERRLGNRCASLHCH